MIRIDELEKLKSNINEALLLSKKKQLIYDEIIGGDDEKCTIWSKDDWRSERTYI